MRTKEKHGACKRKMKETGSKGKRSKTVGRTHTPSYACAATTKAEKLTARQVCALCLKAGRPTAIRHKGKMCPFALGPAHQKTMHWRVQNYHDWGRRHIRRPMEPGGLCNNQKKKTSYSQYRRKWTSVCDGVMSNSTYLIIMYYLWWNYYQYVRSLVRAMPEA